MRYRHIHDEARYNEIYITKEKIILEKFLVTMLQIEYQKILILFF